MMNKVVASIVAALAISSSALAGGNYKVEVKPPATVTKGQPAVALLHIEGTGEFKVNVDYPVGITLTAPAGVQLEKTKLLRQDAKKWTKDGADFEIKFTASEAGTKAFTGELKFAVATIKDNTPVTEKIAFSVTVK